MKDVGLCFCLSLSLPSEVKVSLSLSLPSEVKVSLRMCHRKAVSALRRLQARLLPQICCVWVCYLC